MLAGKHITIKELLNSVIEYNPKANLELIRKAYEFSKDAHKGQKRFGGEEYVTHPLGVATILVDLKADSASICAALLHDVLEDTGITNEKIEKEFGREIRTLVEGTTKIGKVHFKTKTDYTAENLRKILLATAKDVRVMLIKLADRLHNMRTLKERWPEKQKSIAKETMEIYAPIAHKLGVWKIKGELEDLSLRFLEPNVYKFLRAKIAEKREEREKDTEEIINYLKKKILDERGISVEIYGRAKYFYSIYKKMKKKNIGFNEIYDLIAIRVITNTIPECYAVLGLVHDIYRPIPHRFKDYISVPKANGYQSLHTTVITNKGKILEIQIRTKKMHDEAEEGIAAHWRYQGTERDKMFDKKIAWLKQILEWRSLSKDANDFIETLKIDLFEDEIVVFTPKGDPIQLPTGSTPVDFAYMVHSSVGEHCSRALVNNKAVQLDSRLESGDIVEIVTNRKAMPSRQWLKFVKTSRARSKIKSLLNINIDDTDRKEIENGSKIKHMPLCVSCEGKKRQIKLSKCCKPGRSDQIIGFYTKDGKITVHKIECKNAASLSTMKTANVWWTDESSLESSLPGTTLRITVKDKVGVLVQVLNVIARYKINIKNINTKPKKGCMINTIIFVNDMDASIKYLLKDIRRINGVIEVEVAPDKAVQK